MAATPKSSEGPHFEIAYITVGQMRQALSGARDSDHLTFAGGLLHFNRAKQRDGSRFDVEFNEEIVRQRDGTLAIEPNGSR